MLCTTFTLLIQLFSKAMKLRSVIKLFEHSESTISLASSIFCSPSEAPWCAVRNIYCDSPFVSLAGARPFV